MKKLNYAFAILAFSLVSIVACNNSEKKENTLKIGVGSGPEKELAEKLSLKYHTGYSMKSYLELNQDYSIIEMDVPKHWIGKSLMELNLRRKLGLNIIAIKNSGSVNVVPEPEEHFRENDVIVVVGRQSTIIEYIQE